MRSENIILIGMPGAGKSTVGVVLAKTLGMDFVDTDLIIQQNTGRLLQDIIDVDGLPAFLAVEETILSNLSATGSVIATGGSACYSDKAMQHLKSIGKVVYLNVPCDEIIRRVKNIATRGIAVRPGRSLKDVYEERTPLYEKYADITVNCENVEKTVAEIRYALG